MAEGNHGPLVLDKQLRLRAGCTTAPPCKPLRALCWLGGAELPPLRSSEFLHQGGFPTPTYPGCLGSNCREMVTSWAMGGVNITNPLCVFLDGSNTYGFIDNIVQPC